jgi:GT2 family glycosyltransferase
VALESIRALLALSTPPLEILLVDQTRSHSPLHQDALENLAGSGKVRWLRLPFPSIPHAMNTGLQRAAGTAVLFLDDDIVPDDALIEAHLRALDESSLVAGQVLQPGEKSHAIEFGEPFRFNSTEPAWIDEFMGGNFSIDRAKALALGGFDENFVGAAYRFEAEFAHRYVQAHGPIRYEPRALVNHLALSSGGTRAHAHHLRTLQPSHSVGAYYFLLSTRHPGWLRQFLWRPLRAVRTRHHLRRPWWIPLTLISEARGMLLAVRLHLRGARLIQPSTPLDQGVK